FGPFQRPFLVPWSEIDAQPSRSFFTPMVKLNLGKPAVGSLKISARSWSRLVEAVPQRGAGRQFQMPAAPSISSASLARGMLVEWLVITAIAAAFFYFASRSASARVGLPLELCIGFPAVVFGIGQLIRYARQA